MSKTKYRHLNGNVHVDLLMECQEDDLSPAQISAFQKMEQEYTAAVNTQQVFFNNGDVLYENDSMMLVNLKNNIGSSQKLEITPDKDIFLSGGEEITSTRFTDGHLTMPASLLTNLLQNNVVKLTKTSVPNTGSNVQVHNTSVSSKSPTQSLSLKDKYYQLIMDTKLGLIINGRLENNYSSDINFNIKNPIINLVTKVSKPTIKTVPPLLPSSNNSMSNNDNSVAKPKNRFVVQSSVRAVPSFEFHDDGSNTIFKKNVLASLQVVARPRLLMKTVTRKTINEEQLHLDEEVKEVLALSASNFTEWLLKQGLIQTEQFCTRHGTLKNDKVKLKLGMYSDKTKFTHSGGYVWVSDCCPTNFTSIFKSSIFVGAPYEPGVLLKLLYHWSCQTNAQFVVQWVKISSLFLKRFYTVLRAVCVAAIHEENKMLLGGLNKMVEIGVISLGTVSEGNVKRTKAWILGAMETETKFLRLHVIDPINDSELLTKNKILEPLLQSVHKDSIILTDLNLDKNIFIRVGYSNVFQTPIKIKNTKNVYSNENVMEYLKGCVPRMFQKTLSLLSRQVIQQFLDELAWREKYGPTALRAFHSIISCIEKQTKIDTGESLNCSLSKIALFPFMNWQYCNWKANFDMLKRDVHDKTHVTSKTVTNVPCLEIKKQNPRTKLDCSISTEAAQLKSGHHYTVAANGKIVPPELKKLESYYYGQLDGNEDLLELERKCFLQMKCIICCKIMKTNISMMKHLITHALCTYIKVEKWCKYCLKQFSSTETLKKHIQETHFKILKPNLTCFICEITFKYRTKLIVHMHCYHNEVEMPYECTICKFRTSEHQHIIDHFYKRHDYSEKAQCPICLKVIAFKDGGKKITQNIYFFLNHIKKHTTRKLVKKCNRCVLSFINKGVLDYHQRTHHKSCKDIPNVKRHDVSFNVWMPAPSSAPVDENYHSRKISEKLIYHFTCDEIHLKINLSKTAENMCLECKGYILEGHFPGKLCCGKCSFKTFCEKSMNQHIVKYHTTQKKRMKIRRKKKLANEMYCICGYKSKKGNKLAKHAVKCNKKSVYPMADCKNLIVRMRTKLLSSITAEARDDQKNKLIEHKPEQNDTLTELKNACTISINSQSLNTLTAFNTTTNLTDTNGKVSIKREAQEELKISNTSEENISDDKEHVDDNEESPKKKQKLKNE